MLARGTTCLALCGTALPVPVPIIAMRGAKSRLRAGRAPPSRATPIARPSPRCGISGDNFRAYHAVLHHVPMIGVSRVWRLTRWHSVGAGRAGATLFAPATCLVYIAAKSVLVISWPQMPVWPNGQGACLRSRRFMVRVHAWVTFLLSEHFFSWGVAQGTLCWTLIGLVGNLGTGE